MDFNAASLDCSFTGDFILDVFVFFGEAVYSVVFLVAVPVIVNLHFAKSSFNLFRNNEELLRKIQVFLDGSLSFLFNHIQLLQPRPDAVLLLIEHKPLLEFMSRLFYFVEGFTMLVDFLLEFLGQKKLIQGTVDDIVHGLMKPVTVLEVGKQHVSSRY